MYGFFDSGFPIFFLVVFCCDVGYGGEFVGLQEVFYLYDPAVGVSGFGQQIGGRLYPWLGLVM